jgi:multidrug efflux pump
MGGMVAATVLAVFLVPVFYLVVSRLFPGHGRTRRGSAGEESQHRA